MTTRLTHLAINADDLDASRRFYAGVLGLDFAEYLGPEFLRTELNGLIVALQRRRHIGGFRRMGRSARSRWMTRRRSQSALSRWAAAC